MKHLLFVAIAVMLMACKKEPSTSVPTTTPSASTNKITFIAGGCSNGGYKNKVYNLGNNFNYAYRSSAYNCICIEQQYPKASTDTLDIDFKLTFPYAAGTYTIGTPTNTNAISVFIWDELIYNCGTEGSFSALSPSYTATVNVTSIGAVGQLIQGSYSGKLVMNPGSGDTLVVSGQFSTTRTADQ